MTNRSLPPFWAVIPAAGIGSRMRADRPKQYLSLDGRSILEHTLDCFLEHPALNGLVVCIADQDPRWAELPCARDARVRCATGGASRAESVLNGLLELAESGAGPDDWVLVHDAARPNLWREDLDRLLSTLADDPVGGLLGVPVRDTLKRVGTGGEIIATVDRANLWQAFTPQMFRLGALERALADASVAGVDVTDEASAMEWAGASPRMVEGRSDNLKITRPEDLACVEHLWPHRPSR